MTVMRSLIAALLLAFTCAALPARADFESGMKAYEAEDYATAFKEWQPLAEAGDARAQYWVGDMFRYGLGRPVDFVMAIDWLTKAARQTSDGETMRRAVYAVGYMAQRGQGVSLDKEKGRCLYQNSADNGYSSAQWALCRAENPAALFFMESIDWCKRAAAQGDEAALYRLGQVYLFHPDVPDAKGFMHVILAARLGDEIAEKHLRKVRAIDDPALQARIDQGEEMAEGWRAVREAPPDPLVPVPVWCWP